VPAKTSLDRSAPPISLAQELSLLVTLAAIWATSYTFIKIGVATIPPLTLIATRTLIAGLILFALIRMRGIAMPWDRVSWGRFAFQALMNSAVPFTLIAWAERTVDADLAVILNSTTPIFTFLITLFITRHERVTLRTGFGVAVGLAGVTLIVGVGALSGLGRDLLAQLAIVLATVLYAGAAIYGRTFKGVDAMVPAAGSLLAGAAMLVPLSLAVDRPWTLHPSDAGLLALLCLAVFSTAIPFVLYFRLMQTLGPVRATSQAFLRVPFGVAIGSLALGETLSWTSWIGFACVIMGVGAMTLGPPKTGRGVPDPAR
jgi:drug/metabolite transporter (DMT)-like permease